jgi:hypothetical protein
VKASARLRGRAQSFKLDLEHVQDQIFRHPAEADTLSGLRALKDRRDAYQMTWAELTNLADELEREGL